MSKTFFFISTNRGKYEEFRSVIESRVKFARVELIKPLVEEKPANGFEATAFSKLVSNLHALMEIDKEAVYFTEDSGLCIQALKGFPWIYSSYVLQTLGIEGILNLMKDKQNRNAEFVSAIAFSKRDEIVVVSALVKGEIAQQPRGTSGFGYDPIFIPENEAKTFGEAPQIKYELSHRRKACEKMLKRLEKM